MEIVFGILVLAVLVGVIALAVGGVTLTLSLQARQRRQARAENAGGEVDSASGAELAGWIVTGICAAFMAAAAIIGVLALLNL